MRLFCSYSSDPFGSVNSSKITGIESDYSVLDRVIVVKPSFDLWRTLSNLGLSLMLCFQ